MLTKNTILIHIFHVENTCEVHCNSCISCVGTPYFWALWLSIHTHTDTHRTIEYSQAGVAMLQKHTLSYTHATQE